MNETITTMCLNALSATLFLNIYRSDPYMQSIVFYLRMQISFNFILLWDVQYFTA